MYGRRAVAITVAATSEIERMATGRRKLLLLQDDQMEAVHDEDGALQVPESILNP